eukprot:CAMPEP_0183834014 /NCGR_PEP_ID=MMETSP0807_2-20130328/6379_1 /TAXON_ID=88271 /ORGANISM="Picocystis salinarum, Strain CCMP1897" /LENGTH=446 /DNA_ID=CAMNT_0026079999 /DNA_START=32 /DNA_END=1372 /DNA_ORIENTATION=+
MAPSTGIGNARAAHLRDLLREPAILPAPCAHDALSARLIERHGFPMAFMSGFATSASRLAAPDLGLTSYYEVLEEGRLMHEATRHLPIVGDADTGYGNAMNVKRTVRGFADAGFAGVLLEDQTWPKRCGHTPGKSVVGRKEAVAKVRAACDAREAGRDVLVVARTDAYSCVSMQEAMWRVNAFADAGADMVFVDALGSHEDLETFAKVQGPASELPKMASMLEGGGKTPMFTMKELEGMGFKVVAYPLSLLSCSMRAMEEALDALKGDALPDPSKMLSFEELKDRLGFYQYYEESTKYAVQEEPSIAEPEDLGDSEGTAQTETGEDVSPHASNADATRQPRVAPVDAEIMISNTFDDSTQEQPSGQTAVLARGDWLRVKITEGDNTTFDARIPAGWLGNLKGMLPNIRGVDLNAEIKQKLDAADGNDDNVIVDMQVEGQRIQVFFE